MVSCGRRRMTSTSVSKSCHQSMAARREHPTDPAASCKPPQDARRRPIEARTPAASSMYSSGEKVRQSKMDAKLFADLCLRQVGRGKLGRQNARDDFRQAIA